MTPAQRAAQPWLGAMLLHVQRSFLLCASFRFTPKLEAPRQLIAHRIFASNLPALVGSRHLVVPAVLVLGRRESAAMCMSDRNGSRQSIVLLVCRTGKAPAPVVMKVEPQSKKPSAAVSPRAKRFARPRLAATLPRRRVRVLTERIYWLALRSSLQLSSPLRLMRPHNAQTVVPAPRDRRDPTIRRSEQTHAVRLIIVLVRVGLLDVAASCIIGKIALSPHKSAR